MQKVRGRLAAPTVRRHTVSGSFHPPFGVLFTFPSRYLFTIGHQVVLSLGRWSSQIPAGLLVSCGTRVSFTERHRFRIRGCHPLWPAVPCRFASSAFFYSAGEVQLSARIPQLPLSNARTLTLRRFRLVPVRSPLLGESRLIYFRPGT